MEKFTVRNASTIDVPFLVDTIIEAEKSGTEILSYTTIFGLNEQETRKFIADMLFEEIDGCELSISSFIVAEQDGQIAAAVAAWIESSDGIPSTILKGNLLNFTLPKSSIEKAHSLNVILRNLHIDNVPESIQLGLVYVSKSFRGMNLVSLLLKEVVSKFKKEKQDLSSMYVQVFGNNTPAIKAYEKAGFNIVKIIESSQKEILNYLPSNKKILMKREI